MQKWNPATRTYRTYDIPKDWNTPIYSSDMGEVINCAQCGKKITYGDSYTSKQVHTYIGFGYPVCRECYEKEIKEEMKYNAD